MTTMLDTGTTDLRAELHDDGVLVATLDRPETRNAFSGDENQWLSFVGN